MSKEMCKFVQYNMTKFDLDCIGKSTNISRYTKNILKVMSIDKKSMSRKQDVIAFICTLLILKLMGNRM